MSQIKLFEHPSFGQIRTITADNGEALFCGRDVAQALGYANSKDALARHTKGVVKRYPLETAGGIQQARFITEGDVYRLIFNSKLPAAEAFEAWVVDEVLPSIRKHGVYAIDELLDSDELLEQALRRLRDERTKRLVAEQQLLEARPKLSYYDIVLKAPSLLTTTEIAKDYGLSAKKLNQILRDQRVQFTQSGRWFLYQDYASMGYTQSQTHVYGEDGACATHMYWTQKGRLFIYDLLKNQLGILPVVEREDQQSCVEGVGYVGE